MEIVPWSAILRGLAVALAAYALWLALAFGVQRAMVFPRHMARDLGAPPAAAEVVPAGRSFAWFFPAPPAPASAGEPAPAPLVVAAHGNAETIAGWLDVAAAYNARGFAVLLPEYRGYGGAPGTPSEDGIVEDFDAALAAVLARGGVDERRIVFHGRSLGGGVVLALARRRAPAAVITESTFTSVADLARGFLIPRFAVRDPFDNASALRALDRPVLLLHGRPDGIIPVSHATALAAAARRPTLVLHDRDHNDPPPPSYWPAIDRFLESVLR